GGAPGRKTPTMKRDVRLEMTYPHPAEIVWRAISDKTLVGRWLMETDLEPVVGREFQFRTTPQPGWNGIVEARVLEAEPPRRLVYTWSGSWGESQVAWTLEAVAGGTKVTLEHN